MLTVDLESGSLRERHRVALVRAGRIARLVVDGAAPRDVRHEERPDGSLELVIDGRTHVVQVARRGDVAYVRAGGRTWVVKIHDPVADAGNRSHEGDAYRAPMPGAVVEVKVAAGDSVRRGQVLLVIESMKMQLGIEARRDGVVAEVARDVGQTFDRDAVLVRLAAAEG